MFFLRHLLLTQPVSSCLSASLFSKCHYCQFGHIDITSRWQDAPTDTASTLQWPAMYCTALQCSVLQCFEVHWSVAQCIVVHRSVAQCSAVQPSFHECRSVYKYPGQQLPYPTSVALHCTLYFNCIHCTVLHWNVDIIYSSVAKGNVHWY